VDGVCVVCGAADPTYRPDVTLTSISATYSGGPVPVGTPVNSLTGVTVTAHYSDGTSENVGGYTLSGTIEEGYNTITVSYNGKTVAFVVNGVAAPVTLTSISATYSGGSVPAGTAVSDLTGIVVKAHYSDGTSEPVTAYTMTGAIGEGSNTVTVSYGGKTTTFTVVGVAESEEEPETGVSNETTWTNGVAYTFEEIDGSYPDRNTGEIKDYQSWRRSPYLYCAGASVIRGVVLEKHATAFTSSNDNCFYDADKNYIAPIEAFTFMSLNDAEVGAYHDIPVPENAVYVMFSGGGLLFSNPLRIEYVPYE
jgi:hypothetical protein